MKLRVTFDNGSTTIIDDVPPNVIKVLIANGPDSTLEGADYLIYLNKVSMIVLLPDET